MKSIFIKIRVLIFCLFLSSIVFSQSNWKLSKDNDGIKVYTADNPKSKFQSIKVECTLEGTFDKLIGILSDVNRHKEWVYNNKTSYILKKNSANDFIYYSETSIPWPMSNLPDEMRRNWLKCAPHPSFCPRSSAMLRT